MPLLIDRNIPPTIRVLGALFFTPVAVRSLQPAAKTRLQSTQPESDHL